ncbi:hypothetical protein E2C01_092920 [Portunus trituberculatus]|uniref:Uncharacterized protein n=1 Tax=Portunus trituberculatus TaxID=210409 RepID=A0A5B7JRZ3_PORTR|nr:hypothetical protein [Portunus trituberculatus]
MKTRLTIPVVLKTVPPGSHRARCWARICVVAASRASGVGEASRGGRGGNIERRAVAILPGRTCYSPNILTKYWGSSVSYNL